MRFLGYAVRKDLRRAAADPWALGLYLGIPLVIGALITFLVAGGGGGPKPVAHLLVADEDDSVASGLLLSLLKSEQASEFLRLEASTPEAGRALIEDDEASALLVIPEGFQDAVLVEEPAELLLVTNPAEFLKPKIITVGLEVLVDLVFYLHRILGDEIRAIADGPPEGEVTLEDADVSRISVSMNRIVRKIEKYVIPPAIEIGAPARSKASTASTAKASSGRVSFAVLFLPGIILMALFFMAQGLSGDVWAEKEGGTLSRMVSAPTSVAALLAGKLAAYAVLIGGTSLVLLVLGMAYLEVPFARLPLALVWATLSGVTFLLMFVWIYVHARSKRAGNIMTNSIVFPLLMLGGSFFPSELMPDWMAAVGRHTPNGWSLEHLKDILVGRADATSLVTGAAVLLGVGLILFFLCVRRMRGAFARR